MASLLSLAFAIFAGLMMTRLLKKFNLPDVTSYLIAGVLIGPYLIGGLGLNGFGFNSFEQLESLDIISDLALGFIAFSIGTEFRLSNLKETGRQAVIIGIAQAVVATVLVDITLILIHIIYPNALSLPAAITLGAIAAATAPAATLMVVRQYKAKGEVTSLLLPIVALDDAVGLILFAVSFGIAKALNSGIVDVFTVVINPIIEISASLAFGAAAGWLLTQIEKMFHSNTNRLGMTIGFIFLTVGFSLTSYEFGAIKIAFSPLLVCMMMGTIFCNICPLSEEIMKHSERWSSPLLIVFFVMSGAELDFSVFAKPICVVIGIVYLISRGLGKYYGTKESARIAGCSKPVINYLGITLLPQAGVALGMCVQAAELPGDGNLIRNIVLFAVLINQLLGPSATKWALTKSGDIKPQSAEVLNRRENKIKELNNK